MTFEIAPMLWGHVDDVLDDAVPAVAVKSVTA